MGTCVRIVYAPKTKRPPIATVGKMDVGLDEARGTRAGEEGGGRAEGGSRRTRGAGTQGALQSRKVKVFFSPDGSNKKPVCHPVTTSKLQ